MLNIESLQCLFVPGNLAPQSLSTSLAFQFFWTNLFPFFIQCLIFFLVEETTNITQIISPWQEQGWDNYSLQSWSLVKLTTWNSHRAHSYRPCRLRTPQGSTRAQHGWILMRWPAGWQECLVGERALYSQNLPTIQLAAYRPILKEPTLGPSLQSIPFPWSLPYTWSLPWPEIIFFI